jgi:hypothetical protein
MWKCLTAGSDALPAESIATTWKVWLPFFRPLYVVGDVQSLAGLLSSWHTNVRPVVPFPGSFPVNVTLRAWVWLFTTNPTILTVGSRSVKTAVADLAADIVTTHVVLWEPAHSPDDQPAKLDVASGVAVSVTIVLWS